MNTLVGLGTSVAFVYSAYATMWPAPGRQVYFDAVLLIRRISASGQEPGGPRQAPRPGRARSLSRLRPVTARRIVDGVEALCPLKRFSRATACWCCPASASRWTRRFEGRTTVDESMLTGESTPLEREAGRARAGRLAELRRRSDVPGGVARRGHGAGADYAHGGAGAGLARAHGTAGRPCQRDLRARGAGAGGDYICGVACRRRTRFHWRWPIPLLCW